MNKNEKLLLSALANELESVLERIDIYNSSYVADRSLELYLSLKKEELSGCIAKKIFPKNIRVLPAKK